MTIDKKLQKKCNKEAKRYIAKKYDVTQKRINDLITGKYNADFEGMFLLNAIKNWTVELYNREMQKRYL